MKYIVEVTQRPLGNTESYEHTLAQAFDIPPEKAESLVARLPGKVTKPVQAHLAKEIAQRFQALGLEAVVKPSIPLNKTPFQGEHTNVEIAATEVRGDRQLEPDFSQIEFDDLPLPLEDTGYNTMLGVNPDEFTLDEHELENNFESGGEPAAFEDITPYEIGVTPAAEALLSRTGSKSIVSGPGTTVTPQRRGKILRRLLSIAILPTLLTIIGALVVTWFVVRPALYDQLLDSARNPAIAAAASLSSQLEDANTTSVAAQLLETILLARETFPRDSVSFIVATNPEGSPLAASFAGVRGVLSDNRDLESVIRAQAIQAVGGQSGAESTSTQLQVESGERYEIVAQPIRGGGETLGTIVVGVTDRAVTAQVNRILLTTLLFSLIPLALAILFAVTRARSFSNNILRLTKRADEISRGDLSEPIENLGSGDELEDLGHALERLRVSMQEAMERLRRRRT